MVTGKTSDIDYPYIPDGRTIVYVLKDNEYLVAAKEYARENSLDKTMPTGSVVVKEGKIIGISGNGSEYHNDNECERVKLNIPTGEGYELCEGCHPNNHSESRAVRDAMAKGYDPKGSDLYLWGHWWCCEPCWSAMEEAGVSNVYLMEGSERLFNKNHSDNIIGRQFEL
ncbi:MAG: deaminase [Candidatus Colwellbacteria bacterium]